MSAIESRYKTANFLETFSFRNPVSVRWIGYIYAFVWFRGNY